MADYYTGRRRVSTFDPNAVDLPAVGPMPYNLPPLSDGMVQVNHPPALPVPLNQPPVRPSVQITPTRTQPPGARAGGYRGTGAGTMRVPTVNPNMSTFAGYRGGWGYQQNPNGSITRIPHAQPARDRTGGLIGNAVGLVAGAAGLGPLGLLARPLGGRLSRIWRERQILRNAPADTLTAAQTGGARGSRNRNRVAGTPQAGGDPILRATLANPGARAAFAPPAPISGGTWGGTYQAGTALAGLLNNGNAYRGGAPAAQGMGGSDFRGMSHSLVHKDRDKGDTPHRNGVPIVRNIVRPSAIAAAGPSLNTSAGPDGSLSWYGNPATVATLPATPVAPALTRAQRMAAIRRQLLERSRGGQG